MVIDLRTLVVIIGFIHLLQVLVFAVQYKVNKSFKGIGWWLLWCITEVIGFTALLFRDKAPVLSLMIIIQNVSIVGGTIFIFFGIRAFFNKDLKIRYLLPVLVADLLAFHYFVFIHDDIQIRSIIISFSLALIALLSVLSLFAERKQKYTASIYLLIAVLILHSSVFFFRTVMIAMGADAGTIFSNSLFNILPYFDALVVGLLLTVGIIIMINQRLNAEISEAREELQIIFNTSPDAALISRMSDGKIIAFNEGFLEISGHQGADIAGKSTLDLQIWNDLHDRQEMISRVRETGEFRNFEAVFRRKDGSTLTGLLSSRIISIQGINHLITITRDITERKRLEREHRLFHQMLNKSPAEIYIFDKYSLKFINVNEGAMANIGFSMEELREMTPPDIKPELALAGFEALIAPMIRGEKDQILFSTTHRRKNGSVYPVEVHISINHEENVFVAIILDVSRLREQEERLRETSEYLNGLFNYSGSPIIGWDRNLLITRLNPAFETLSGYAAWELTGRTMEILIPAEKLEDAFRMIKSTMEGERWVSTEIEIRRKDGQIRTVLWNSAGIRDAKGEKIIAAVALGQDITERKIAENRIRRMNAELEFLVQERTQELQASNRELEAFSYTVAHDLRAPLRGIDGFSRILLSEYHDRIDDEGKRLFSIIRDSTQKMGLLIDDLLAFSQLQKVEIHRSWVNINDLILEVFNEIAGEEQRKKTDLQIESHHKAYCDPALIRQVIVNLLSNAIKFSAKKDHTSIIWKSEPVERNIVFSVQDNGVGFDMKYSDKLFGVFNRLHHARDYAGTGVGLAIVKRIVERHGGKVWAEGWVNTGAIFFFSIPLPKTAKSESYEQ